MEVRIGLLIWGIALSIYLMIVILDRRLTRRCYCVTGGLRGVGIEGVHRVFGKAGEAPQ
jgi:hypothetical protein